MTQRSHSTKRVCTHVSNGITISGNNNEITQAQNEKEPNSAGAIIAQNGYWGNLAYGYRGWTTDGNIYYYSNKDVYQLSGQSPVGVNTAVLFKTASPSKTEDSPAYTGMRIVQMSADGKKYAAITAALNGKMKIFNTSDNSEAVDLSSLENTAQCLKESVLPINDVIQYSSNLSRRAAFHKMRLFYL